MIHKQTNINTSKYYVFVSIKYVKTFCFRKSISSVRTLSFRVTSISVLHYLLLFEVTDLFNSIEYK